MLRSIWLLSLLSPFSAIVAVPSVKKYMQVSMGASVWPPFVSQSLSWPKSKQECASLCNINAASVSAPCMLFAFVGNKCYLGSLQNNLTLVASPAVAASIYMDTSSLNGQLSGLFIGVPQVASKTVWAAQSFQLVYGLQSTSDCFIQCEVQPQCDVFVFETSNCYLGKTTSTVGSATPQWSTAWTVYVKNASLPSLVYSYPTGFAYAQTSLTGSQLASYTYQSFSPALVNTSAQCTGECLYDTGCYMSAFDTSASTCYLASFNATTVVAAPNTAMTVTFPYGRPPFNSFTHVNGDNNTILSFIYNYVQIVATKLDPALCEGLCLLQTTQCQFVVAGVGSCLFGNFQPPTTIPGIQAPTQNTTAYVNSAQVVNTWGLYYVTMPVNRASWQRMYMPDLSYPGANYPGISKVDVCATACTLWNFVLKCHFFVIENGNCYLANFNRNNPNVADESTYSIAYLKKSALASMPVPTNQYPDSATQSSSAWTPLIYRTVNVSYSGSTSASLLAACQALCYLDQSPCLLYVQDGGNCNLGSWNVGATVATSSNSLTVYSRRPNAGLVYGVDSLTHSFYSGFDEAFLENDQLCAEHALPQGPIVTQANAIVYADPYLFMCGGETTDNVTTDACYKLDVTASPRQWVPIASMPESVFNFRIFNVAGYIYAVGGSFAKSPTASFSSSVHRYDIATNQWTSSYLSLDVNLAYYCGVTYNQKIYIVGGKTMNLDSSYVAQNDTRILQVASSPQITTGPTQSTGAYSLHCGLVQSPTTGNSWLVTAGGGSSGSTYFTTVQYLDLTAGATSWTALTDLPFTVKYLNNMMVLSNRNAYIVGDIFNGGYNTDSYMSFDFTSLSFNTKTLSTPLQNQGGYKTISTMYMDRLWTCIPQSTEWFLLLRHDSSNGNYFSSSTWATNATDRFSNLTSAVLSAYKSCTGQFHFRLVWPELGFFNEWWQTSDPTVAGSVTGYQAVAEKFSGFGGLQYSNSGVMMRSPLSPTWFWVGAFSSGGASANQFTGPTNQDVSEVRLLIKKDC